MIATWKPYVLGAVLLALASPIVAQTKDLAYNTVPACTLVYTSEPFAANETRTYNVVGNGSFASQGGSSTGCGVPGFSNGIAQVQAVEINVVALAPAAGGALRVYPADQPNLRTMVSFTAGVTIADTGTVAVSQTPGVGDITIQATAATHVIVKVVGYYSKPVQTVYVHPVPGDHAASGTALLNAMNGITNASATKRYVIKLEPGNYDLGSTELVMKPYVDLEGSGQEATVIQGPGNNDGLQETGVVEGASSAELRDLQIKSIGSVSQSNAIAFFSPVNTDTHLRNVTLMASGAVVNWGLRAAGGSPVVEECTIRAQGGSSSYGLIGRGLSRPIIKRTLIEVTNGSGGFPNGGFGMLFLDGGVPAEVRDVQIRLSGAGTSAYGIYINGAQEEVRITSSTIDVAGASTNTGIRFDGPQLNVEQSQIRATGSGSIGVYAWSPVSTFIEHSEIASQSSTVDGLNVFIGATRLHGGAVSAASSTCAGVYDETFTFYAGPTCP